MDYVPRGQTITGQYYAELIRKLREKIKEKRRGKLARGVLLLHDNARVHTCGVSLAAIKECGFEIIPHPPYSPDLAPSDYHLFKFLKNDIRGKRYNSDDEIKSFIENWIQQKPEEFFSKGINDLLPRNQECIKLYGEYLDK